MQEEEGNVEKRTGELAQVHLSLYLYLYLYLYLPLSHPLSLFPLLN